MNGFTTQHEKTVFRGEHTNMAEQQPDPFLQALRSHGTHFFLFLLISADLLAALFGFFYGAFVGSWLLAFLYWVLTGIDYLIHRDLLSTVVITILVFTLVYGLIRRLWTAEWRSPRLHMLTISIPLIMLWFLLEVLGVRFGQPTAVVRWIPSLRQVPFPNPFPPHLWPFWQVIGVVWAAGYLYVTHHKPQSPRPQVNIKTVRVPIERLEPEPEPGVDPFHLNGSIVDAILTPKTAPGPQYYKETRIFPLSIIHEHSEKWTILEQQYKNYRAALKRFSVSPVRRLSIPSQAMSYKGKGAIGWQKHQLVLPEDLFLPENAELLSGYLAHELAYFQGIDLWVRDLTTHYPNEITRKEWQRILIGNVQVLPTAIKIWYLPGWEHDRTKDGDVFTHLVGEGPKLKRRIQYLETADRVLESSASLNPDSPTSAERIMQLEGLMNVEHEQMRAYGLVPPTEEPVVTQPRRLKKGTRKPPQ